MSRHERAPSEQRSPLKITLGCLGRGYDIDPVVALALALRERGHAVTIAGSADGAATCAAWHVPFRAICDDLEPLLQGIAMTAARRHGNDSAFLRASARHAHAQRHRLRSGLIDASAAADVLVMPAELRAEALTVAELLGKPLALLVTSPFVAPSRHVAIPIVAAGAPILGTIHRLSHARIDRTFSTDVRRRDDREWRASLALPNLRRNFIAESLERRIPQIHVYSRRLYPRPSNWPAFIESAGRIALSPARKFAAGAGGFAPDLARWLDAGPPPVAFAIAHPRDGDAHAYRALAEHVSRVLGVRAVISSRRPALLAPSGVETPDVFVAGNVDHDHLFARCRAVVHHGGTATTATAARAGIPSVICSQFGSEAMWGERLRSLGVAEHLELRAATANRIVAALKRLDRTSVRQRAHDLGTQIRAEDGVPAALAALERLALRHNDGDRRPGPGGALTLR